MNESRAKALRLAQLLAPQLRQECGISDSKPLDLSDLLNLARLQEIRAVRFNARLASEGLLEPLPGGGFAASISRSATPRGRYTLAHEIGHTFFRSDAFMRWCSPPNDRDLEFLRSSDSTAIEEVFCDLFASELLLPSATATHRLAGLQDVTSAQVFLDQIEGLSTAYAVSLRMLLIKAYTVHKWPHRILVAILSADPVQVERSGLDVQVLAAYSDRTVGWYMPNQQAAAVAGFRTGVELVKEWTKLKSNVPLTGIFEPSSENGIQRRHSGHSHTIPNVLEPLHLKRREPRGDWSRHVLRLPVAYRLYASSPSEAYVLAIAELEPTPQVA